MPSSLHMKKTDVCPDVEAAATALRAKFSRTAWRALEKMDDALEHGEHVIRFAIGMRPGLTERVLLVLTDHKVIFMHEGLVRSSQEAIPLDLITSVAVKKHSRH